MTNPSISPGMLYLITTGWGYAQDIYWLLTTEGAKEQTTEKIEELKDRTVVLATTPKKGISAPFIPEQIAPTIEKIDNIMDFMIPASHYLGKLCFYTAICFYAWHITTRLFTTISIVFFAAAAFFGALWADLRTINQTATLLRRDFKQIMDKDEGSLQHFNVRTKIDLTKNIIQNSKFHVEELSKSLFLLHYILQGAINQTESHLKGLDEQIISS
ncbi:hypothetical protein [Simkania sp.]|uniref:hypothetical protein n=1 Tax=Simkania sp. TaxID=34094 RepID=UPI003B519BB8